ncbi:MAG: DUF309 domain-containing protein [Nitrososphaerota archaeon]|nr:DUF309 domain-containing protein [Nitrososphaerota archaeon]
MRFLVRLKADAPSESLLESVRTIAKALGVDPKNPKWTSYGALEIDVFSPSREDFELFVSAIRPLASFEFTKDLNVAPPYKAEEELFAEARELFNAERYWESHEVLEGAWRTKTGEEKRLLQGIILVCAAFVHHQKGEGEVALGVLRRSAPQLEYSGTPFHGFDLVRLRQNVHRIIETRRFENFAL